MSLQFTEVSGNGCVAEAMRSQISVPQQFTVTVAQSGNVTLVSASPKFACSFTPAIDESGFTTVGIPGFYNCEPFTVPLRCADGMERIISSFGQDITGRVADGELSGSWMVAWFERDRQDGVEVHAQYKGRK